MKGILEQLKNSKPYTPGSLKSRDMGKHIDILENSCKYNYHTTSGFPKTIVLPSKKLSLSYTKHARAKAKTRFFKPILPETIEITWKNLIEIHTNDNINILKAVVKLHHNGKNDIILVLELLKTKARVITVYRNAKNHSFETLTKKFNIPSITFNDYQEKTNETDIYSPAIRKYVDTLQIPNELKAANLRQLLGLTYVVLGMAGEAGELANKLKKIIRDNNAELTAENLSDLQKENGDITWYNAQAFKKLGMSFEDGAKMNLKKLFDRKESKTLSGSGDNR